MMKPRPASSSSAAEIKIDPKWTWHYETLLKLRDRLVAAQSERTKTASEPLDTRGGDDVDTATEEFDHTIILGELHAEAEQLTEVEAALQRIRGGTYGICEESGEPIAAERLRAIPWTRYSRSAAQRNERRARETGSR